MEQRLLLARDSFRVPARDIFHVSDASIVDLPVGDLIFRATDGGSFEQIANGQFKSDAGKVLIGYKPSPAGEDFLPLVRADLTDPDNNPFAGELVVFTSAANPKFTLERSTLELVVGRGLSGALEIWQSAEEQVQTFNLHDLTGNGVVLDEENAEPIQVSKFDFSLTAILFANPDEADTSDAQVKMQGVVSLDRLAPVNQLNIDVEVDGMNFVIADANGLDLTGLDVKKTFPSDIKMAGLALSGAYTLSYTRDMDSNSPFGGEFSIGGEVSLKSDAQDQNQKRVLNGVSASLDVTIDNGTVSKAAFGLGGSVEIAGLSLSTPNNQEITLEIGEGQLEISGTLVAEFGDEKNEKDKKIEVELGSRNDPGIIFKDGKLIQLEGEVEADLEFGVVTIETAPSLGFEYDRTDGQYEVYGGVRVIVGEDGDDKSTSIAAQMGSKEAPGLVIEDGVLTHFSLTITGGFSFRGLNVLVKDAGIDWKRGTEKEDEELIVTGDFEVDFDAFTIDLNLGRGPNEGIVIKDGQWQLQNFELTMNNAPLGPLIIKQLDVKWDEAGDNYKIDVGVTLPGGATVEGSIDFQDSKLNDIALDYQDPNGIAVGDTGLFLTDIDASVKNLANPSQIVVSGSIAFTFAETIKVPLVDDELNLFRVEGDFTVDANELVLDATAWVGAFSLDQGKTWQGVLGKGDAILDLNWAEGVYSLHVDVDALYNTFDLTGDFTFAAGRDIRFLAEVDVKVPEIVPILGGTELGGAGFLFDHTVQAPNTTTLAAWAEWHFIADAEIGFEIIFDAEGHATTKVIGAKEIEDLKRGDDDDDNHNDDTYTYSVDLSDWEPDGATSMILHTDWSKPAAGVSIIGRPQFRIVHAVEGEPPRTYKEDEFAEAGIVLIDHPDFDSETTKAVQVVGSTTDEYTALQGDYKLLIDVVAHGGKPFPHFVDQNGPDVLEIQATSHVPKPIFGKKGSNEPYVPIVPSTPKRAFGVMFEGNMDEGFRDSGSAQVSLYRVLAQDPEQRPVLVGSATPKPTSASGVNWQAEFDVPIDDLFPLEYKLYAVVNDGSNVPVQSGFSEGFTPAFAVQGGVSNQLNDALTGWSMYLDYNQNGVHDDVEPITQTSNPDGFYAFPPSFASSTSWEKVPDDGTPFDVRLIVPSDEFVPDKNPITVTYDGEITKVVEFTAREKSAIKGVVFVDQGIDGNPVEGAPLAGATVYLDANGNDIRDADETTQVTGSDGRYAFRKLGEGTYTVGLDTQAEVSTAAYDVSAEATAIEAGNVARGMAFDVQSPIDVTSLGVFDSNGDGFAGEGTLTAILYDRVTQHAVARLEFTHAEPGTLDEGSSSRFKPLEEPIRLYVGFQGLIVAESNSSALTWGFNVAPDRPWTTNAGLNQLTFVGGGRFGDPGAYPPNPGNHPVPNPYAAGSFLFVDPIRTQTSPESKTTMVTVDDSGFDLKTGNNFGVEPFSTISGTITARQRNEGHVSPNATPQSGVTLHLVQNDYVASSTTSGTGGSYDFSGLRPGAYTVEQVVPSGYRQIEPFTGKFQLSDPMGSHTWQLPGTQYAADVVVADFDGNGQPDTAVLGVDASSNTSANIWAYYNGDFTNPVRLSLGAPTSAANLPVKIVAAFLEGGSRPDLAVLYSFGTLTVLPNQSGALQNGILYKNLPNLFDDFEFLSLVTGDFGTGFDGRLKLAVLQVEKESPGLHAILYASDIDGGIAAEGTFRTNMAVGDINKDGITDIFVAYGNADGNPVVYYTNSKGDLSPTTITSLPAGVTESIPGVVVLGDINGDGRLDLGIFDQNRQFHYTLQDPSGAFPQSFSQGIGVSESEVRWAALKDVNGDFRPDLVWTALDDSGSNPLVVALNTGTPNGWFSPAQQTRWPLNTPNLNDGDRLPFAMGDLDGNGLSDVVVLDQNRRLVQLVLNESSVQAPPISIQIQPAQNPTGIDFVNAQLPKSIDHRLELPGDIGAGDWTVRVNGDRLEVHDSEFGLWDSRLYDDLRSLTIVGADSRPNRITLDISDAPIDLFGGIQLVGSGTSHDTLRILLGDADDDVSIDDNGADVNDLLPINWTGLDGLTVEAGGGDDTLGVRGTPAVGAITLNGGPGDDIFDLATQNSTIHIRDSAGTDALDFSDARAAIAIHLAHSRGQQQRVDDAGNWLHLHAEIENVFGSDYDDRIWGNAADNWIVGGAGDDRIWGRAGDDILEGGRNDDFLFGGFGNDRLIGGLGLNKLVGGPGRNVLIDGPG